MYRLALSLLLLSLVFVGNSFGWAKPASLAAEVSLIAGHKSYAYCDNWIEWHAFLPNSAPRKKKDVYGYTFLSQDYTPITYEVWLRPDLCRDLLRFANHHYDQMDIEWTSLALLVLTHESYHLQGKPNETEVECLAINRVRQTALDFGANTLLADSIYAIALQWDRFLPVFPYHMKECEKPISPWFLP